MNASCDDCFSSDCPLEEIDDLAVARFINILPTKINELNIQEMATESYKEGFISNAIVEEVEEKEESKIKYSDILYNIDMKEKCHTCNLDSYTLIKNNENMFQQFLDIEQPFQISMFNLLKSLVYMK